VEGLSEGTPARVTLPVLSAPQQAVDPVCGMTVTVSPDAIHATVDGVDYWFCNHGCRKRFMKEHAT
jgi:xanthine dehydrogenase accessory factor